MPEHELYTHSVKRMRGAGGRPSHWENREELIDEIVSYLKQLVDDNNQYLSAPSMNGLGIWLGYAAPGWERTAPHQDVLGHVKMFIRAWREGKIVVPRGGINPAALMFLLNREEQKELGDKTIDGEVAVGDDRPTDVVAAIEDAWLGEDDK